VEKVRGETFDEPAELPAPSFQGVIDLDRFELGEVKGQRMDVVNPGIVHEVVARGKYLQWVRALDGILLQTRKKSPDAVLRLLAKSPGE
jgi:hypothetical protein